MQQLTRKCDTQTSEKTQKQKTSKKNKKQNKIQEYPTKQDK